MVRVSSARGTTRYPSVSKRARWPCESPASHEMDGIAWVLGPGRSGEEERNLLGEGSVSSMAAGKRYRRDYWWEIVLV